MAQWAVRVKYGPEEFKVIAPGEDEAREKAWQDAVEQLEIDVVEELTIEEVDARPE